MGPRLSPGDAVDLHEGHLLEAAEGALHHFNVSEVFRRMNT